MILPILISGFIHLSCYPEQRLRLHRYDGQLLYLKSAKWGAFYLISTSFLCFFLKDFSIFGIAPQPVTWLVKAAESRVPQSNGINTSQIQIAWLLVVSIFTVLSSILVTTMRSLYVYLVDKLCVHVYGSKIKTISLLGEILKDSPIDKLFYDSFAKQKPILVTCKSKKIYVGIVNQLGEPNESSLPNQEISIVPVLSGYRNKDDLKLTFTNDYNDFSGETDLSTIIKVCEIESSSWFDVDIYENVNGNLATTA